jgi:hypothetical protein
MKPCSLKTSSDFTHIRNQKRKRIKTPENIEGACGYSTYEIPYLMAGRLTAFAGIATSDVVLRNEKKEWFLRKVEWAHNN